MLGAAVVCLENKRPWLKNKRVTLENKRAELANKSWNMKNKVVGLKNKQGSGCIRRVLEKIKSPG